MLTLLTIQILLITFSPIVNAAQVALLKISDIYLNLKSPNYPQAYQAKDTVVWSFQPEGDGKLKLQCDDFRLTESEGCTSISLEIDNGIEKKTICGQQENMRFISENKLTLTLKGDGNGQAAFSCSVKNMEPPEPEVVDVEINKLHYFEGPKNVTPFFDKLWQFRTEEGQQIQLKCYVNLIESDPCYEEILTLDLGEGPVEYCGFEEKIWLSKGNLAKLRLELGMNGVGQLHCFAQAVVKEISSVDKVVRLRADEDEDSSEHGGPVGSVSTTCKCGWANKPVARIINGREASPNEYPWIVGLKAHFGPAFITCGGSIVTQRHVLTAAHCLLNMYVDMSAVQPQNLTVITGAHNIEKLTPEKSVQIYTAENLFIRPEFIKQYTHDFAIVVTSQNMEFTKTVGPICLSPKRIAEVSQLITIIGWGKTETGNVSPVLLKAKTAVIEPRKCNELNPWEICTRSKPSATCTGDSGGPLSWLDPETNRYTLMSVVSYGDPDCVSSPSVSTDIAYFYEWVQDTIKTTYPELKTCTKQ